ncbi:DivIVA domain-containing protein [Lentzea xinjiangensis]|uniref:Cell wall synthesis protein Wag31 n=1 Tax=Lentzea xinjiangensis TaxID=402600 RepID=A0A1H9QFY1_9PSEU|nr:DivIVA domain-containing protein [Lentzea xinjiangensis]SER59095.1 DivIVA domain-containing protein [Lentzea xinjiangensis]
MSVDGSTELLPLRTWFGLRWRGYDRDEVDDYVAELEAELRLVIADRNASEARAEALASRLASIQEENAALQDGLHRICLTPIDPKGLPERLARMVALADEERREVLRDAQLKALMIVGEAEQRARRLDEEAAAEREEIREDFRLAMSARRAEAMRALAELRNAARDEADRIVAEAKVQTLRIE